MLSFTLLSSCIPVWAQETETDSAAATAQETEADSMAAAAQETEADVESAGSSAVEDILSRMSVREKVAQMFVVASRTWEQEKAVTESEEQAAAPSIDTTEAVKVTSLNDELKEFIANGRYGGFILYAENCSESNEQTLELTNELQTANQDTDSDVVIPLLIATDQEGGVVARLSQGIRGIGSMALSATGDPENITEEVSIMARELSDTGIITAFAPVLDVNDNPANPVIGIRSFSDDPETVAEYGNVFIDAMSSEGIITSLKHFPGHGNTDVDSHTGLPLVNKTYDELKQCELIPFQSAIDHGAEMIMTAHIQYPQIEKAAWTSVSTGEEIYLPATLSHTILTDILRDDMGFEGVVVTDAMEMDAINDHFGKEEACCMAIEAGVDLILMPLTVNNHESILQMESLVDSITEKVEKGEIPEEYVDTAVTRILTLKEKHGLLEPVSTTLTQEQRDAASDMDQLTADIAAEWEHATKALTLIKNENDAFPADAAEDESVLFVYTAASRLSTADMAMDRLKEEGIVPESVTYQALELKEETREECLKAAGEADHVIVVSTAFSTAGFDPNSDSGLAGKIIDEVIDAAHEAGHQAILVSAYLPYDAARYQTADAIILTYGSVGLTEPLTEGKAYVPNLLAGLCCAFGEFAPTGTLPIVIPALDENWAFTDEVLYDRGTSLTAAE